MAALASYSGLNDMERPQDIRIRATIKDYLHFNELWVAAIRHAG